LEPPEVPPAGVASVEMVPDRGRFAFREGAQGIGGEVLAVTIVGALLLPGHR
jgi:hypothetical protein